MDPIGATFGNYRIETALGAGGTGQIYRAVHIHLGRPVALKVLHPQYAADPGFQARFLQEARSAAALRHPNIVEILDFGEDAGRFYLVMELVTGGSVRTLLSAQPNRNEPLDLGLGIDLVRQAAGGLGFAHRAGMVHRDVKPDNLLLVAREPSGYLVKVTDFGLARLAEGGVQTLAGTTMGTPVYMSPEQCQGIELDGRSDLYSLGVTLYELTTGYVPFQVRNLSEAVFKHVNTPAPSPRESRPDLPVGLERVILRCLEKKPADRYATMEELIGALDALSGDLAIATVVPGMAAEGRATAIRPPEGVRILLRQETASFTPGVSSVVGVTLANPGEREQRLRLSVEGIPAAWLTLPSEITLPPSSQREASIGVLVPRDPAVGAGDYPITLQAASPADPGGVSTTPARWTVLPFNAGALDIAQERGGWRLTVENLGNAPAVFALRGSDEGGRLDFAFTPPTLNLKPGDRGQVSLRVRPREGEVLGTIPFRVEARAGDGPPPAALGSYSPPSQPFGAPIWALAAGGAVAIVAVILAGLVIASLLGSDDTNPATPSVVALATATSEVASPAAGTATTAPNGATATTAAQPATATQVVVVAATPTTGGEPTATFGPTATATATATPSPTPAPRYPTGLHVWRAAGNDFAAWELTGVNRTLEGALQLDPIGSTSVDDTANRYTGGTFLVGEALGPQTAADAPFTRAVASWNATTPPGSWIEVLLSARVGGTWTPFFNMGIWAADASTIQRTSVGGQPDNAVDIDTLKLSTAADAYQVKLRLFLGSGDDLPVVQNVAIVAYPEPAAPATLEPGDPTHWGRTLQVPVCSSTHASTPDSSATSLAMVLAWWDGAPDDCAARVAAAVDGVFDREYGQTGNWPFAAAFAFATHPAFEAYIARFPSLAEAEYWIEAGVPLIVSFGYNAGDLPGAPVASSSGRLAVLVGFADNGDVIVNEPGVAADGAGRFTYAREAFERVWLSSSGGVAYLIYPATTDVPRR